MNEDKMTEKLIELETKIDVLFQYRQSLTDLVLHTESKIKGMYQEMKNDLISTINEKCKEYEEKCMKKIEDSIATKQTIYPWNSCKIEYPTKYGVYEVTMREWDHYSEGYDNKTISAIFFFTEIDHVTHPIWLSLEGEEMSVVAWRKKSQPYQGK